MDKKTFALADFLDKEIDALPDAPVRGLLPAGSHIVQITNIEPKKMGEKEGLIVSYKYITCEELANPKDEAPKPGDEYEEAFFTETEGGLGALKEYLKNVKQPGMTLGTLIPALVNQQFRIKTSVRKWKNKVSGEAQEGHQTVGGLQFLAPAA